MRLKSLDARTAARIEERFAIRFFPAVRTVVEVRNERAAFERRTQHLPGEMMPLGAFSYSQSFAPDVQIVGRYCSIGRHLQVIRNTHPLDFVSTSPVFYKKRRFARWSEGKDVLRLSDYPDRLKPVVIDHDVWIGDNVTLRGGCRISTGAVVAHNAVVTRDVAPYEIVGGVPARPIRSRFAETVVDRLLASEWWQFAPEDLQTLPMQDPTAFIEAFGSASAGWTPVPESRRTLSEFVESLEEDRHCSARS